MRLCLARDHLDRSFIFEANSLEDFVSAVEKYFTGSISEKYCVRCYLSVKGRFPFEWTLVPNVWIGKNFTQLVLLKAWKALREHKLCVEDIAALIDIESLSAHKLGFRKGHIISFPVGGRGRVL